MPETGTFLSRDPVESEPPYQYVRGNPVNRIDLTGYQTECDENGYCSQVDRYLCGPNTPGGYDSRGEPCIVNPENVQTGSPPAPTRPVPVHGIPISPADEAWKSIQDDRELTYWLFDELQAGPLNIDVNLVRENVLFGRSRSVGSTFLYGGLLWRALVRDRARYDFKHAILGTMRETILFRGNDGRPLWSEYSVPGNIFFGYVGSYVGFEGWMTHVGAGYAEAADPSHKPIRNFCDRYYVNSEWWRTLFDDPLDYQGVELGINLWRKYGHSLTLHQFRSELKNNYSKLAPPPALPPIRPGTGEIPAYGWRNPGGGWPYEVGDFNGPDEEKYWPPDVTDPDFYGLGGD